jgi:hypothetical protein
MMVVATEDTSGSDVQVSQNLVSQSLIPKDDVNEAQVESRFHFDKH